MAFYHLAYTSDDIYHAGMCVPLSECKALKTHRRFVTVACGETVELLRGTDTAEDVPCSFLASVCIDASSVTSLVSFFPQIPDRYQLTTEVAA